MKVILLNIITLTLLSFIAFSCNKIKMTDQEMKEFVDKCYAELENKQDNFQNEYGLGKYQDYWWDQEKSTLEFKNNGKVEIAFDVIFIGTWAKHKNDWLWAWANTSMVENVKKKSIKLQELNEVTGFSYFTSAHFDCDEKQAWKIAAMSIHILNGIGMYRSPGEKSDLFLIIMKKHL